MTSTTIYKIKPIESIISYLGILIRFRFTFLNIYCPVEWTIRTLLAENVVRIKA